MGRVKIKKKSTFIDMTAMSDVTVLLLTFFMLTSKIKKKSTFIDMTAMSDVTVLLLTFFMLTSTFVKPEPVKVNTPGSVSEIKIPETDILQILIAPDGKVFMSMDRQSDLEQVLTAMGDQYGIQFTAEQINKFSYGRPVRHTVHG